jgi:hypothetical protein
MKKTVAAISASVLLIMMSFGAMAQDSVKGAAKSVGSVTKKAAKKTGDTAKDG